MIREIILTFFYSGKAKFAPGTFGSLAAILFWFAVNLVFFNEQISLFYQNIFWLLFLSFSFFYSLKAIKDYAKKTGEIDHKSVVIDEVIGIIIPLQLLFLPFDTSYFFNIKIITIHLSFCFILFRFFDIKKPLFIGYIDRNIKTPFGVILDDVACGLLVLIIGLFALYFI